MKKTLKNAIFLQPVPYTIHEGRLTEYHGAVFAEQFQKWGVNATKMVVGDPSIQKPQSPLLSISSMEQRVSPKFWKARACDLVVIFNGGDIRNVPVIRAIKDGSPKTTIILRMDTSYCFFPRRKGDIHNQFKLAYINDRHGHVGQSGHESTSPIFAIIRAVIKTSRLYSKMRIQARFQLYEIPDFISFRISDDVDSARSRLIQNGFNQLANKIIWMGNPVRDMFASFDESATRSPASIISVANWKHAKDITLHAKALARVFEVNKNANIKVIGQNSVHLVNEILRHSPDSESRIALIEEISNMELPRHLHGAQIFMMCSFTEGYCSAVAEALCAGCSSALSTGIAVPSFREFTSNNCGTQAKSRHHGDMANAVLAEIQAWNHKKRDALAISQQWGKVLITNLCHQVCTVAGFEPLDNSYTRRIMSVR